MSFTSAAAEGNKSAKKRWRIGRRNKPKSSSKSKSKSTSKKDEEDEDNDNDNDNGTAPATPECSDGSDFSGASDDNYKLGGADQLPSPMSDVDDNSDDDDDDVYLDNHNLDDIADLPKPPPPMEGEDPNRNSSSSSSSSSSSNNKQLRQIEKESPNSDKYDNDHDNDHDSNHDSNHDNNDDDMERHLNRRNSPVLSKELHKIVEDDEDNDGDGDNYDDNYDDYDYGNDSSVVAEPSTPTKKLSRKKNNDNNNNNSVDSNVDNNRRPTKQLATKNNSRDTTTTTTTTRTTSYKNEHGESINLPSPKELSKELCKIVATDHYSGDESLCALEKLSEWAHTQDSTLLKHFLTYGGVVKVIDFLKEQIDDNPKCKGDYLMDCIHKAVDVICNVCFVGKHGINEDIAVVNATVVVKYNGIQTLLLASDEYCNGNDNNKTLSLKAAEGVWNAIMNVYCNAEAAITKDLSMFVLDAAIDIMAKVGSIDHPIASETLANVFNTLYRITYHDYVTKEEFQQKKILSHCLNVFKRDVTSSDGDEELLEEAISFFYGCHEKVLFSKSSDYERVLPLCVMGLREFAHDNVNIREWATKLLDGACSNINNKQTIIMAEGAIEALAPFLTSKHVDAAEKDELRKLIRKIVAP